MLLASFDIFDTTLIRRCGSPSAVFELLAKEMYPHDSSMADAFLLWRSHAEQEAAARNRGKENSLSDIYATLPTDSFREHDRQEFMAAERTMEARLLTANPAIRTIINNKRREGWQIVFISDMYLDSRLLKEILVREGCAEEKDKLYVSCEHQARKDIGDLYEVVRRDLHPTEWEHYGDNLRSDMKMARKHGIKAVKVDTSMTPAEKALLQKGILDKENKNWQLLPAISRTARIVHGNTPYTAMAADFVAPAYIPYVLYFLKDAKRRGIRRLYFLSRDSYILMRIAEALSVDYPDIELRYLFVSRRALILPYLHKGGKEEFLAIADHHTIVRQGNIEEHLIKLGTTKAELAEKFGIEFGYNRVGDKQQEEDFLNKIFNSDYTPTFHQRANDAHAVLKEYFCQEGLNDNIKSAMVDVGWLGTTRLMINSILRRNGMQEVEFYYYGIRGDVLPETAGRYYSYFKSGELSTEGTGLIENYYSASPYPSTIGYERDKNGHIIPIFKDGNQKEDNDITLANINVACSMAKEMTQLGLPSNEEMLFRWVKTSIDTITTTDVDIDLSPLETCSDFDTKPFVRRMGINEVIHHVLMGKHITAFDWASLRLSLPHWAWKASKAIGHATEFLRRQIYLRFLSNQ